jgi:hypothetical protein
MKLPFTSDLKWKMKFLFLNFNKCMRESAVAKDSVLKHQN